jgi:nucleoside-diphosphate-sugar epimerase
VKVLFIGGTGIISSACVALAVERGLEVTLLNRGNSDRRVPAGVRTIHVDIHDTSAVVAALGRENFDAVADFIAFVPEHVQRDLEIFRGRTGQLLFISSASAYQTPPLLLPITESSPLCNPVWKYSRDKIACEEVLVRAYREEGFPITIVRPSHTYDERLIPLHGGYTNLARMRAGKPIVVHGDGTSLWVLTHHRDFARGFVGLIGNNRAIGEAVHITSDECLTWNEIARLMGQAIGVQVHLVPVPSARIADFDQDWGDSLLGDKTHSVIFDNTKLRRLVPDYVASIPFARGAREIAAFYETHPEHQRVDSALDALFDTLLAIYGPKIAHPPEGPSVSMESRH